MKHFETRKNIARRYYCIGMGAGDIQTLLSYQSPEMYHYGVYGWNFDAYTFGDYCITTGYRSTIHNFDTVDCYELRHKYELKAREIQDRKKSDSETWTEYEEKRHRDINALLEEYLRLVFDDETIKIN